MATAPRPAVLDISPYRTGRVPADLGATNIPEVLARLASNESPFGPLPHVVRTMESELAGVNRYPEVRGGSLRAQIGRWLGLPVEQVTVGPGSSGLLWQIAQVFLDDDSEMVVPWPSFEGYPIVAQLMGARLVKVPVRDDTADIGALVDAVSSRTKVVVLAEPNNPTGTAVGATQVRPLVEATAGRCLVVVDEAYIEFDPATNIRTSTDLVADHPHVIVLRTFSKAHGLAGLRVGYAVASPSVIDLLDRVAPPFAVSSVAHAAAGASLDALDEIYERVAFVRAERERVLGALRSLGMRIPSTVTNFVWIPCGARADDWAARLEADEIITRSVPGHGIRVTVGDVNDNDRFLDAFGRLVDIEPRQEAS